MKKWFETYLQLDKDIDTNSYRRNITGKLILFLSYIILVAAMLGNFVSGHMVIFYVNITFLTVLSIWLSLVGRHRKYSPQFILHLMALGVLAVVYFKQGTEYTPIWCFLYIFLVMSLYGHKIGLYICLVFMTILLSLLFSFTGETINVMEFFRFSMASCFTLFFAYWAELLISRTFGDLIAAKEQLVSLTKTDALTGLLNRRNFNEVLAVQMSSVDRSNELLALVIIDIDHFKTYNDTFGHPAGDVALIALANLFNVQMKRITDSVFRIGGEEFALLYQTKNEASALKVIEDIRQAVEGLDKYCELEQQITISAGLLHIHANQNITVEKAYELADALLYEAKNSGRNKVVTSS
ncbi:GGDEF domain-containing protein [Colwellia echini]|uniref:diguanylate cyclase n=1 Tax=Colwellia echini TaxID=1982103 RepID=A0ABY3MZF6_9GAMM|nr:GGDEF domain-containing protein [Colwellia echini]TYK66593.1 GGDEF domain-containing protein [Colwellia echini]